MAAGWIAALKFWQGANWELRPHFPIGINLAAKQKIAVHLDHPRLGASLEQGCVGSDASGFFF